MHPVLKEEQRITNILKDLLKSEAISKQLYESLKPTGSQAPRLYGLEKYISKTHQ